MLVAAVITKVGLTPVVSAASGGLPRVHTTADADKTIPLPCLPLDSAVLFIKIIVVVNSVRRRFAIKQTPSR